MQGSFGQNLLCDVAGCSSIAEKPSRLIEHRVAADGNHAFGIIADLALIDKVTERFVPVQHRQMFLPFPRLADDIGCQLGAGSADADLRILTKRTNVIGQISEPMLLIGLPEPVG